MSKEMKISEGEWVVGPNGKDRAQTLIRESGQGYQGAVRVRDATGEKDSPWSTPVKERHQAIKNAWQMLDSWAESRIQKGDRLPERSLPPSGDVQEQLRIVKATREQLLENYGKVSDDSYVDRAEYRDAIWMTHEIEQGVSEGKPTSYKQMHGSLIGEDATEVDRRVAEGALGRIQPMINKLEGAGYRFAETAPGHSRVARARQRSVVQKRPRQDRGRSWDR